VIGDRQLDRRRKSLGALEGVEGLRALTVAEFERPPGEPPACRLRRHLQTIHGSFAGVSGSWRQHRNRTDVFIQR
jgi:hypothetical protein